jgi:YVTN family beta-propeller protein
MMNAYRVILSNVWLVLVLSLLPMPASWASTVRVYVTNNAGDSIHVIDPSTNNVVQEIKGIEGAHGIAFSPDGTKVYVSNEIGTTLDVFNREAGKLV